MGARFTTQKEGEGAESGQLQGLPDVRATQKHQARGSQAGVKGPLTFALACALTAAGHRVAKVTNDVRVGSSGVVREYGQAAVATLAGDREAASQAQAAPVLLYGSRN